MPLEPMYDRGGIQIWHADCLDVLPLLDQVDHVITDPPYSPRAMKNARSGSTIKQRRDHVTYDFGYEALSPSLRAAVAIHVARLARRWALVWSDIESAHCWRAELEEMGLRYVRTGVWVREHGAPQFSGDRPAQGVEAVVITHSSGARMSWNGGGRPATWIGPIVNSQDPSRVHASPKPLWLMRELIEQFTDPDDLILDPFMGSGTTLRAAKDLGRSAIGIEMSNEIGEDGVDRRYCDVAVARMAQEVLAL